MIFFILFIFLNLCFSQGKEEVYNRILTDKFFRGVVADNIIESKKYDDIISGSFATYSELRYEILKWVEENPGKAAERFIEISKEKGGYTVSFKLYDYVINPKFKELIDKMEYAAKDSSFDIEKARSYSSYLFDAIYKTDLNIKEGAGLNLENSSPKNITYDYLKLNSSRLSDEVEKINKVYEYLKEFNIDDINGIVFQSDIKFKEFYSYVMSLKGNKGVTSLQAEKLISLFKDISKLLYIRAVIVRFRLIEKSIIENGLDFNLESIKSKIIMLYQEDEGFNENFMSIFSTLDRLEDEVLITSRINSLKRRIQNIDFSCFFDYISYIIATKFLKMKKYDELYNKKIDINFDFTKDEDIKNFEKEFENYIEILKKRERIAKTNRFIQYIFWDNFLPFDIFYHKNSKYFGLKLPHYFK